MSEDNLYHFQTFSVTLKTHNIFVVIFDTSPENLTKSLATMMGDYIYIHFDKSGGLKKKFKQQKMKDPNTMVKEVDESNKIV